MAVLLAVFPLLLAPLVVDNGCMYTAGFADDAAVFAVFPSVVGKLAMPFPQLRSSTRS